MSLALVRRRAVLPARPSVGAPAAVLDRVGVRHGGRTVLHDLDLDLPAGRVTALVGPNGAGKSTALAVLAGDLHTTTGRVLLHGRALADWTPRQLGRYRAVLPQQHRLAFPFRVAEVVAMGRAPWAGTPAAERDGAAIAAAMAATGVLDLAGRGFATLSGGEQARVALARVLAQECAVLLLDEPTAALDLRYQELVLSIARQRAAAGDAVLVVLHDLGLAAAYADAVIVLRDGRVAAAGPPARVFTAPLLSDVYQHDVEVFPHPRTGTPLVLPRREEYPGDRDLPR